MRLKVTRILLLFWIIFIGVGAYIGGICMLIKPDGSLLQMQAMLPYFQVLPFSDILFQDYIFSGIMLIIVNGISNTIATYFLFRNKKIGYILGTIFGFTLILWIIIQLVIFPPNLLDTLYFIFGILQFITGYIALVSYNQEYFIFNKEDYSNIKALSDTLVVYFSRKKYTKKIAYQKANELESEMLEITTNERTKGDLGFWWCGRFGMHNWKMDINEKNINLDKYKNIIIVTPIWVFKMASPIRGFVDFYKEKLSTKNITVIFNHFNPWLPKGAIKEIKNYIPVNNIESKTTMLGHIFK